ncbi:hypothetical protein L198_08084 [Cryptococcus wingfieldii CBS 7118]|uniref:Uncharacterized protein n=1 Tax=Cryptococcus wingfieldii CBS 7118 TaxID=1295528 RepID=A0A1E3HJ68_9TREE|nr:hypothetical protein L198_08084 [Cryptococcus wingfieldii CBS 7118]ODN76400.1 hypothetical protein L198_08084 [Cryptococcus wingfieldii CBS 7118]
MAHYQQLATSPSHPDAEEQYFPPPKPTPFRHRLRLLLPLVPIAALSLIALALLPSSTDLLSPQTLAPHPSENEHFFTGDIWAHNDLVAAKLERCASLGLLRNTSRPLHQRLSDEEELELQREGCGTNETTVVILSSLWFAESFQGHSPTGETVYAQSIISSLNALGYSYFFSSLGWWNSDMRKTTELWHKYGGNVRMVISDPGQLDLCWNDEGQKCLKTEENPEGIPAWRMLAFWYWDTPGNPLGPKFTLSPSPLNDNFFLSYSIEPTCLRLPFIPHSSRPKPPQAYLLAKQIDYLSPFSHNDRDPYAQFAWTLPFLSGLQEEFNISVVGGMRDDNETMRGLVEESGIRNLGELGVVEFYEQLAESFVLVGVGQPRISPSPWDALCMGVPFINPILAWDEQDPENRTKWHTQQWHMTHMDPPYVYPTQAHNLSALSLSIQQALENPLEERYIPEHMTFGWVKGRMGEVVEGDWEGRGREVLDEWIGGGSGEGKVFVM